MNFVKLWKMHVLENNARIIWSKLNPIEQFVYLSATIKNEVASNNIETASDSNTKNFHDLTPSVQIQYLKDHHNFTKSNTDDLIHSTRILRDHHNKKHDEFIQKCKTHDVDGRVSHKYKLISKSYKNATDQYDVAHQCYSKGDINGGHKAFSRAVAAAKFAKYYGNYIKQFENSVMEE